MSGVLQTRGARAKENIASVHRRRETFNYPAGEGVFTTNLLPSQTSLSVKAGAEIKR